MDIFLTSTMPQVFRFSSDDILTASKILLWLPILLGKAGKLSF
jgi:hypothetical protein